MDWKWYTRQNYSNSSFKNVMFHPALKMTLQVCCTKYPSLIQWKLRLDHCMFTIIIKSGFWANFESWYNLSNETKRLAHYSRTHVVKSFVNGCRRSQISDFRQIWILDLICQMKAKSWHYTIALKLTSHLSMGVGAAVSLDFSQIWNQDMICQMKAKIWQRW